MKNIPFLMVAVFSCLTMCTKENSENAEENLCYKNSLLSQVNSGNIAVHGLTYNSNCLLYESTEPFTYKKYSYNSQNQLIKVETAHSFNPLSCSMYPGQSRETDPRKASITEYSKLEYAESLKLIKKLNYSLINGKFQLVSSHMYDYKDNRISKISSYNNEGQLMDYHSYEYDSNGNVTADSLYTIINSVLELRRSVIYEFDGRNNPFVVFASEGIPGLYTNKNNILNETTIISGNPQIISKNNTYEYNSLNLPVSVNGQAYLYGNNSED